MLFLERIGPSLKGVLSPIGTQQITAYSSWNDIYDAKTLTLGNFYQIVLVL